jgi:quercetin dioxygenase-like cupin family protein
MSKPLSPILRPAGAGTAVNVLGAAMLIRLHGRDTGGTLSAVETQDLPGSGPPPHVHACEDETFQVLEGDYEFLIAGKTIAAPAGTTAFAPRGVPHTYRCVGPAPGRLLCVITPAGFERFFEEIGALSPAQQQEIPRLLEIAGRYGLQVLPPS